MNIYDYVSLSNPVEVKKIIRSFGYSPTGAKNISNSLSELVANEGSEALIAVLNAHPDKDVILEVFSKQPEPISSKSENRGCGCGGNCRTISNELLYLNAAGGGGGTKQQEMSEASRLANTTNTMLLASALILAVAIIVKK